MLILESKVKAALNVLGRNKSQGMDRRPIKLLQAIETEYVKNPNKDMSTNVKKIMARLETFNIYPYL